jgi:hypothetical protein
MDTDHGERLARIETKVDALLARGLLLDERITTVERKQWWLTGAGAFAAAFVLPKFKTVFGL